MEGISNPTFDGNTEKTRQESWIVNHIRNKTSVVHNKVENKEHGRKVDKRCRLGEIPPRADAANMLVTNINLHCKHRQ